MSDKIALFLTILEEDLTQYTFNPRFATSSSTFCSIHSPGSGIHTGTWDAVHPRIVLSVYGQYCCSAYALPDGNLAARMPSGTPIDIPLEIIPTEGLTFRRPLD